MNHHQTPIDISLFMRGRDNKDYLVKSYRSRNPREIRYRHSTVRGLSKCH